MKRGFTLIELLVVITIIGILVALALPNFIKAKDKALEAEVKSNLHSIQVSLERYATDNGGTYPAYIYGGSLASWRCTLDGGTCLYAINNLPEPMMRYGFLGVYPRNPFVKHGQSTCALTTGDPRFGCVPDGGGGYIATSGTNMANILMDPNFQNPDTAVGGSLGSQTPGGQPLYFIGDGDPNTQDFLPGNFLYRTFGESAGTNRQLCGTFAVSNNCGSGLQANNYSYYFLSGYGSLRTAGKDYLHCWDPNDAAGGFGSLPEVALLNCDASAGHFSPGTLQANEPVYGAGDVDGDGDPDEIPNVVFQEAASSLVVGGSVGPSNADGQLDGLLIFFNAGSDQSVGL